MGRVPHVYATPAVVTRRGCNRRISCLQTVRKNPSASFCYILLGQLYADARAGLAASASTLNNLPELALRERRVRAHALGVMLSFAERPGPPHSECVTPAAAE